MVIKKTVRYNSEPPLIKILLLERFLEMMILDGFGCNKQKETSSFFFLLLLLLCSCSERE